MIVKMSKYTMLLHRDVYQSFLGQLQSLGMVDITTSGWEPDEQERNMLAEIETFRQADERLSEIAKAENFEGGEPYASGRKAMEEYRKASTELERLKSSITKSEKELEELRVWGDFDSSALERLSKAGVHVNFYQCYSNEFDEKQSGWSERYIVERIADSNGSAYFAVVSTESAMPDIDAQPMPRPTMSATEKEAHIAQLKERRAAMQQELQRCASSLDMIREEGNKLKDRLQFSTVERSGHPEAEGHIVVLEGWAPQENADKVDALLDSTPELVYLKERPTPEDDTPVLLKNNRYAHLFEIVGNFYELPKYGTMDLTPYFAPWYMLFFGFCLGDAGYGALFVLIALFIKLKKMKGMQQVAGLTMWLGASTILFGLLTGNVFGIQLAEQPLLAPMKDWFLDTNKLFYLSLGMGVVQILFGMVLNVINTTHVYGFKYSFGTLGWLLILLACICAFGLPMLGVAVSPVPFYVVAGIGAVLMLFLHNPDKNVIINFGAGLWNTYNNVTGLLGDVLSYVRLFALCLSGSALAIVFNSLALSLAPDIPVVRQLVVMIILIIGHGMNMFMSAIGAFAHPMRLTFVEFYKNAGFVSADRAYRPFRKEAKE